MKRIKVYAILVLLMIVCFSQTTSIVNASGESLAGDYFNKVFDVKLENGNTFFETAEDSQKRENINTSIYEGTATQNYSLYDRFGGQIAFVPYFGETKIMAGMVDYFYSKFSKGEEFTISESEMKELFDSVVISNNVIYEGRPDVLSDEQLESGYIDTRVYAYEAVSVAGGDAALGNTLLSISNFFTTIIGWLSGSGLYQSIDAIWRDLMGNGVEDVIKSISSVVIPIAICIFLIILVSKSIKIVKGSESGRKVFFNIISVFVSLGIAFTLISNPIATSDFITKIVSLFDNTLDSALQSSGNEVVVSDDTSNVRVATLWNQTVFEPWCEGMFGAPYSELYTQYDTSGNVKMKQSNSDILTAWTDGTIKYNSAGITGDVTVKTGTGGPIRNWAALAWSTQSVYHIDAIDAPVDANDAPEAVDAAKEIAWPKASAAPMNDSIYIDDFRWIDAKLNISPEYHATDSVIQNYSDSKYYDHNFTSSGFHSFYLMLLLIPIAVLTIRKLVSSVNVVSSGVQLCYCSILNLIMPDKYDVVSNLKKLGKNIYDLFWWSIIIFLGIAIYSNMINVSLLGDFIWIFVGIYLCKFKPIRTSAQVRAALNTVKKGARNAWESIKSVTKKKES